MSLFKILCSHVQANRLKMQGDSGVVDSEDDDEIEWQDNQAYISRDIDPSDHQPQYTSESPYEVIRGDRPYATVPYLPKGKFKSHFYID